MGWFEVLSLGLDVVQIGVLTKQGMQLKGMNEHQLAGAMQQEILEIFKNLVFASNKSAEALAEQLDDEPQKVFILARLLQFRLENYGINPDIFSEFGDKEYVNQTQTTISALVKDSAIKLSEGDLSDAETCVKSVQDMPALNEAISIQADRIKANDLKAQIQEIDQEWKPNESRMKMQRMLGIGLAIAGPMMACVCFGMTMIFGTSMTNLSGTLGNALACLMFILPFGLFGGGIIGGIILASRAYSKEHAEITKQRNFIQGQLAKIDQSRAKSPDYEELNLAELTELRNARQSFIQKVMGDADEDYDYDMVFLDD